MNSEKRAWLVQAGMLGGVALVAFGLASFGCDSALARDLDAAARSYTNSIKTIGQIMSVAGVIAGGICMQIPGVTQFGKSVLAGGLVGGLCSFGAPAFASFLTTIFGSG